MHTVDLKKANGTKRMTVLADEAGKAIRVSKREATAIAATIPGAKVSCDNFHSTGTRKGKCGETIYLYNAYFIRIHA